VSAFAFVFVCAAESRIQTGHVAPRPLAGADRRFVDGRKVMHAGNGMRCRNAFIALAGIFSLSALGHELDREAIYRQNPAVLAHYHDLPIALETPALKPGRNDFTSQDEMESYLSRLKERVPGLVLDSLGTSQNGRAIPYLLFSHEGLAAPADIVALNRPILWFIGQQHGNEPAGGEAMLALATMLAEGELKQYLDRITVVVVPRANPDGAAAFTRATANHSDLNRDHILLSLPESRALHAMLRELPPDVVVDAHEFSVANRWLQKFGVIEASDVTYLYATHPAVSPTITALAEQVFRPALDKAFATHDLESFWYHTTSYSTEDKMVSMGGNAPGIARNTFGLMGAVSFVLETRGVGVWLEAFQRRVATHVLAAEAIITTAAAGPERLHTAVLAARREIAGDHRDLVLAYAPAVKQIKLPMLDPETGERRPTEVQFQDSRAIIAMRTRPRPAGYLLADDGAQALAPRLEVNGVLMCTLTRTAAIDVESFELKGAIKPANRESINPEHSIDVELKRKRIDLPEGTLYIPMSQPAANIIAAALEPDSPGSFIGTGILPTAPETREPAIFRAGAEAASTLKLAPASDASAFACGG
jgi:hypothetical protein